MLLFLLLKFGIYNKSPLVKSKLGVILFKDVSSVSILTINAQKLVFSSHF